MIDSICTLSHGLMLFCSIIFIPSFENSKLICTYSVQSPLVTAPWTVRTLSWTYTGCDKWQMGAANGITNTLVSVIHSFAILLASIWYNLESFK